MNNVMRRMMDDVVPKFNKNVVDGPVENIFRTIPEYIDSIFQSSIKSLHQSIDLKYLGYRFVSPEEEFTSNYATTGNDTSFDLAHSDVYPVKFIFSYRGEEFERELLLPYARRGNLLQISGTNYIVAPVLTDTIITADNDQLFARLLKDKITFKSFTRNFIRNKENKSGPIIWAEIMKNNPKSGELGKPLCGISLYLFAKYGVKEVINRYFRDDLKKRQNRDLQPDDIIFTNKEIPELRETHNVFESTKLLPQKCKSLTTYYIGHNAKFYIKKDIQETDFIQNCIYGVLNGLDNLPHEADELIEHVEKGELEKELFKWKIIIATISSKGNYTVTRRSEDVTEHFYSIDNYIDSLISSKFKEINYDVENFFDLIYLILTIYNEMILSAKEYSSDIRNNYLDVNYYICYDLIIGFNKVILDINKGNQKIKASKGTTGNIQDLFVKELKKAQIEKIFQNHLKTKTIFSIIKSKAPRFNITPAVTTGCSMYWKCTSIQEHQSRGKGVARPTKARFPLSMQISRAFDTIIGTIFMLPKNCPSAKVRANVYMKYNENTGRIIIDEKDKFILETVDLSLKGKEDEENLEYDDENIDIIKDDEDFEDREDDYEEECGNSDADSSDDNE